MNICKKCLEFTESESGVKHKLTQFGTCDLCNVVKMVLYEPVVTNESIERLMNKKAGPENREMRNKFIKLLC